MQYNSNFYQTVQNLLTSGFFGVLLFILLPGNAQAFQFYSYNDTLSANSRYEKLGSMSFSFNSRLEVLDYDKDGDFDLAIFAYDTVSTSTNVRIIANDGSGNFNNTNITFSGWDTEAYLRAVDFNNDGNIDLMINGQNLSSQEQTKLYKNNGDSTFTEVSISLPASSTENAFDWGDIDNDGDLDLIIAGYLDGSFVGYLYENTGAGNLTVLDTTFYAEKFLGSNFHFFDYNNDGFLDLLGEETSGSFDLYENDGAKNFTKDSSVSFEYLSGGDIEIFDADNDYHLDIMFSGLNSSSTRKTNLYINGTSSGGNEGTFSLYNASSFVAVSKSELVTGDFNNDGKMDVIVVGDSSGVDVAKLYTQTLDPAPDFEYQSSIPLWGINDARSKVADFDGDNDLDFIIHGDSLASGTRQVHYYKNLPDSSNSAPTTPSGGAVSATAFQDSIKIFLNYFDDDLTSHQDYNYYLARASDDSVLIAPESIISTGKRTSINRGNLSDHYTLSNALHAVINRDEIPGGTYYVGIQAIDVSGAASAFSTSSNFTLAALSPITPTGVTAVLDSVNESVSLSWNSSENEDFNNYEVFVSKDSAMTFADVSRRIAQPDSSNYTISNIFSDTTYYFYVTSVNTASVRSGISEADSVYYELPQFTQLDTFTGVNISATTWGDYDNDGDLDVVLTGSTNGTSGGAIAELYDNDGSGNFTKNSTISSSLTGASRSGAAFGDYNNDGYLDLVIIGYNTSNVGTTTLYKNNGNGTFSTVSGTGFTGAGWASASWGDYNNDGFLDLFIGGLPASGIRFNTIYENNGDGTFSDANAGFLGSAGGDFVHADYDNDGDIDVALAGYTNAGYAQSKFYRNDNGTFNEVSSISSLLLANDNATMEWGDFDDDGDLDLFNAGGGNAKILLNDGSGGLSESGLTFTGVASGSADWGDYDLDGDIDLLYNGYTGSSNSFFMDNDGDGTFTLNSTYSEVEVETGTTDWVDIDTDGDLDLLVTGYLTSGSRTTVLYKNNESATNTAPTAPASLSETNNLTSITLNWNASSDTEGGPVSYSVYLVNDDSTGFLIPSESDTSNGFRRLTGMGNSGITTLQTYSLSKPLNGDFTWYVQAIDASGLVSDFASSSFTETSSYTGPVVPTNVSTSLGNLEATISWDSVSNDFFTKFNIYQETDSSSNPSNLIASITDTSQTISGLQFDTNYYFYVTSVDTFGVESATSIRQDVLFEGIFAIKDDSTLSGVNLGATAWGDYDNDGDLDVVVTGTTNGGNSGAIAELYDNDGSGNFTKNTSVSSGLTGAYRSGAAFGDYDNDGFLDLVIVGYTTSGSAETSLYNNDGDGTFTEVSGTGITGAWWASASWADYNNDGFLDLLLGGLPSSGSRFNTIYENNGDGTFTDASAGFVGTAGGDFVAADYDNDGDVDMAVAGYEGSGSQSKFYRNDNGTFTEISSISSQLFANDNATMEWGDFDNDGDLDLFNSGGGSAKILLNDGSGGLSNSGLSFNGVWNGSADWSDYDLDGDLDLFYTGNNGGSQVYLYDNDGDGTFTLNTDYPLVALNSGTTDFVDIDNDGDSDVVITGSDGSNGRSIIYENKSENDAVTNTAPGLPSSLSHSVSQNTVTLSWNASTDSEGGPISYSLYLVNDDSTGFISPTESDTSNGYRRLKGLGNSGITTSHKYSFPNPPNGDFSWFVQAVDAAGLTSDFIGSGFSLSTSYTSPEIPSNITATIIERDITFSWDSVAQDYFGTFNIYQETDSSSSPSNLIASTTDTSYTVSGISYDTNYYFYITNEDVFEQESDPGSRQDIFVQGNLTLQNDTTFTGVNLGATAWGDYDNDGDLDLVITGTTNGGNSGAIAELYDNDGSGNFTKNTAVSDTLVGAYRSGAAFGDYDNDGYIDLVIIGYNSLGTGTTSLYNNNGDGTFSTVSNTGFEGGGWASASWGDYNNDGLIDLFIGGLPASGTRFNTIYENNGDGTFSDANAGLYGTAGGSFTATDYDNDGDLDVVLSGRNNFGGDSGKFYKNVNGSFIEIESLSQQLYFSDQAYFQWVDYDNDEDLDLFMTGNGATRMLINDGSGGLTNSGISFSSVYEGAADFSDYDFDGDMDVFYTGNFGGRQSYFYENDGDGTFTLNTNYTFPKTEQGTNDWVDVDNDGKPELFITGISSSGDRIATLYENITSGTNSTPSTPTNLITTVGDGIATFSWDPSSDVEGSGISYDVFVYNQDSTTAITPFDSDTTSGVRRLIGIGNAGIDTSYSILLNTANYRWGVQAIDATGKSSAFSKTSASITIQAAVDSISSTVDGTSVTLTWNPAEGSIDFYTVYKTNESAVTDSVGTTSDTTITINNLDRDQTFYFSVKATSNSGLTSTFSPLTSEYIDPYYTAVSILSLNTDLDYSYSAFADMDNDNDYDLLTAGYSIDPRFYENTGSDTLFYSSDISDDFAESTNNGPVISFADYDNDGDLDVVISGEESDVYSTRLYNNNGNNTFSNSGISLTGAIGGVHAWGDYDNDGDVDLFIGGIGPGNITEVLKNNNGSFAKDTTITWPSGRTYDAEWGDIDNDSDIDLVLCNANETSIYRNDGIGGLTKDPTTLQQLNDDCSLSLADYDNDKDLDLLVFGLISSYGALSTLYKNDGSGAFSNSGISIPTIFYGDSDWGDFDADGDLDVLMSGYNDAYYYTRSTLILVNDGNDSFSQISLTTGNGAEYGNANFVDADNDQDLDIFLSGGNGVRYFRNSLNTTISAPAGPSNIQHRMYADTLRISWDPSSDATNEPITYEVMVALNDTGLVTPLSSDSSNGARRLRQRGNADLNNSFDLIGLDTGTYKVGIQSINGASIASEFKLSNAVVGSYVEFSDTLFVIDTDSILVYNPTIYHPSGDSSFTLSIKSGVVGTVFIDENNNNIVDAGEALSQGQTYYYADIQSDSIKYTSSIGRYDQSPLSFSSIIYPNSTSPNILALDQTPSISGTADQGGWYLLSNSMNTSLGTFMDNVWTQGAVNADTETGTPNLYFFNQDSAKYVAITSDLDTMSVSAGTGILAYLFPDDNYDDEIDPVNGGWPKVLSNFGNPFGNSVEIPVRNVDIDGTSTTTGSEGFALLGNPYTFPISVDSLVAELVDVDAFANRYVYLWDPINKHYELKLTGSIDAYTSFFVRTIQSGNTGNVNLRYSDYYAEIAPKIAPSVEFEFTLTHKDSQRESTWLLKTTEEANAGIDPNDGYYLGSYAREFANLYTLIGDQPLSINNLPNQAEELFEVPLYLDATITGKFDLSWNSNQLPEGWTVELIDLKSGNSIDVKDQNYFSFEHEQKAKAVPKSPADLYTFDIGKTKAVTQPTFILKVNTGQAVSNEDDLGIPREVELYQNYPNPFNPSSVIRFGVPEQAPVQLEVFDILGRKVMTLLNGEIKQPGRYNINFDGRSLASGMYIYRLVIGNKVLTKKMTLIK